MSDELKPCLKCGSNEIEIVHNQYFRYHYKCLSCGYIDPKWFDSNIEAIAYWNIRPEETRLQERIDELENNVMAFASQLQAWELDTAADEVIKEILGGNVNAHDYYALKNRIDELESAIQEILNYTLMWQSEYTNETIREIALSVHNDKTGSEEPADAETSTSAETD